MCKGRAGLLSWAARWLGLPSPYPLPNHLTVMFWTVFLIRCQPSWLLLLSSLPHPHENSGLGTKPAAARQAGSSCAQPGPATVCKPLAQWHSPPVSPLRACFTPSLQTWTFNAHQMIHCFVGIAVLEEGELCFLNLNQVCTVLGLVAHFTQCFLFSLQKKIKKSNLEAKDNNTWQILLASYKISYL